MHASFTVYFKVKHAMSFFTSVWEDLGLLVEEHLESNAVRQVRFQVAVFTTCCQSPINGSSPVCPVNWLTVMSKKNLKSQELIIQLLTCTM